MEWLIDPHLGRAINLQHIREIMIHDDYLVCRPSAPTGVIEQVKHKGYHWYITENASDLQGALANFLKIKGKRK